MPNFLTSRLAAHLDTAQATTYAQIGKIEASVDRFVHGIWSAIQRGIQGDRRHVRNQIQVVLNALPALHLVVNEGLYRAAFVASEQAQETLLKTLPVSVLSLATEGRGRRKRLTESLRRNLTESVATPGQQREIRNLLFDPMAPDKAQRIVYGTTKGLTWDQRLSALTRLADAQTLAPIIDDWARGELPPRELERRLLPVLEGVRTSARRVARTEAARVATEARFEEYEQLGEVVIGYQVFGTMDARIRPHHAARNGNIYYRRPQPGQLSMEEMPRPPIEEDGTVAHNCFPGNTAVEGNFDGALKTRYTGQIFKIKTRSGFALSCTPNHPICTKTGFRSASQITKSDYLVCHQGQSAFVGAASENNEKDRPSLIQDVFRSAQKLWSTNIKTLSPLDLHGDAAFTDSQVEIVAPQSKLMNRGNPSFGQTGEKFPLVSSGAAKEVHPSQGSFGFNGSGVDLAPSGCVSGGNLGTTGRTVHEGPFELLSVGSASRLDASRLKPGTDSFTADHEFISQLFDRNPGLVFFDEVVDVQCNPFDGHVFDLQSRDGFIVANGIVTSNCRCWIVPVVGVQSQIENDPAAKKLFTDAKGSLVPDPSVYQDWFANASEEERAEVVGQRRYALMMDKLQARPSWGHFLDPKTGRLMSLQSLERETPERQRVRMARVNEVLSKRRELAEKVRNYGYVPPDSEAASKIKEKDRLLPRQYVKAHLDRWMKQNEFKTPAAMRAAIKADASKPEFVRRITYGVSNGSFRGYLTDQGQPLDTREAAKAMAQVQYIARGAKPESKPRRTVIGLPPGTAARIRAKPGAPFRLSSMAPIGRDVFDPIARGLEQVEVVIEPGTPIIRMGADRYLPPGEYAILAVTPTDIRIKAK